MFGWLKKILKAQRVTIDTDARVVVPKIEGVSAPKFNNPQATNQTKPVAQAQPKPRGHYAVIEGRYVWVPDSLPAAAKSQTPAPAVNKPVLPETSAHTVARARQPRMSRSQGVRITPRTPRLSR